MLFFSYIQVSPKTGETKLWSNAEEMCRVNTFLLSNFLDALPLAIHKTETHHASNGREKVWFAFGEYGVAAGRIRSACHT